MDSREISEQVSAAELHSIVGGILPVFFVPPLIGILPRPISTVDCRADLDPSGSASPPMLGD